MEATDISAPVTDEMVAAIKARLVGDQQNPEIITALATALRSEPRKHDPAGWWNPSIYRNADGVSVATCGCCGHQTTGEWNSVASEAMHQHITAAAAVR